MQVLDPLKLELKNNVLIEASAGTGKTYTITTLFTRLVAAGFSVDSILVVTFTEAAAAELKQRIRKRLASVLSALETSCCRPGPGRKDEEPCTGIKDEPDQAIEHDVNDELELYLIKGGKKDIAETRSRIRQGIICFDEASIMTIHSFCFKILRENAFETGALFNVQLTPDTRSMIRETVLDFMAIKVNNLDPLFLRFLKQKNFKVQTLVSMFTRAVSRPCINIIPAHAEFRDVSQDYRDLCHELLKVLQRDRGEIMDILNTHPGVNRRSYSKKTIGKWLDTAESDLVKFNRNIVVDEFNTHQDSDFIGHIFNMTEKGDSLYKFTSSRLNEKNKKGQPVPEHLFFDLCERLLGLSNILETNVIALKTQFFAFAAEELENKKDRLGICFFDDIVNGLADALEGKSSGMLVSAIRKKYLAGLIDEFQDTDQRQYSIFSKIFSGTNSPFFMIGDPKQAIYAFRGGDIFAYLRAVKDAEGRAYTLEKNWRSDPALVNAVNTVFMQSTSPFYFKDICFSPVKTPESAENRFMQNKLFSPPLKFLFIPGEKGEIDKSGFIKKNWAEKNIPLIIAQDIAELLISDAEIKTGRNQYKKLVPGDIAVLVRTNQQAEKINQALVSIGIPSYISKTGSVFDASQAVDIADLLAAVLEPENSGLVKAALCADLFSLSGIDIFLMDSYDSYNFAPSDQYSPDDSDDSCAISWQDWHRKFKDWKNLWEQKGIIRMLKEIFYSQEVMADGNNLTERALTNYYHLAELLHRAETEKHFSPFSLLKWFFNQLVPDMREEYSDELRLETDSSATALITIHKSKGMEYPIVYLPYLWEGVIHAEKDDNPVFHDPLDCNKEKLDLGSETIDFSRQRAVFEEQAENMRLLYVALTRAASMCKIIWGSFKSVDKSALGTLIHGKGVFSEAAMIHDIAGLVDQSNHGVSFEFYKKNMGDNLRYSEDIEDSGSLCCRKFKPEIAREWKFSSFSQLSAVHKAHYGKNNLSEAETMPAQSDRASVPVYNLSGQAGQKLQRGRKLPLEISLAEFPRGPVPGELIHEIFENIDFKAESSQIKNIIESKLVQYGFNSFLWTEPLVKAFSEILETPLYNGHNGQQAAFSLKDIKRDKRLNEMEFIFPFKSFSRQMLSDIFKKYMNHPAGYLYAQKILDLEFKAFKGFMKGFVDLVFEFKEKWYIVDYKSNYLGDTYSDYSLSSMTDAMIEHHYFLQYHIYVTAVHRYLGLKLKNYNYNTHFGGVLYLFVRGMHPDYGTASGVFQDRPDHELIKKLSALF